MWYNENMIKKATWAVSKAKPAYTPTNTLLKIKKKKPVVVQIEVRKKKNPNDDLANYLNSKNYKPSDGTGVGY